MKELEHFAAGILGLAMMSQLVGTPEQRAEWARQADWQHYASKYTD